jgi:UDP-N-acetylmuramyl pentapeptide phosphotransferase/UDP-N-acetylglucosamine-1-phosphate transferase
VAAFLLAIFCMFVIIPQILLVAFRKKLFDVPCERSIHTDVVPRIGGFAFLPAICFSILMLLGFNLLTGHGTYTLLMLLVDVKAFIFGFCSLMMLYLLGIADDMIGVRYRTKFIFQIFCGILLVIGGLWIDNLNGLFGIYELSPWIGYPLTVLATVLIINATNLIDGIDGLSSGLAICAFALYGMVFFAMEQYVYAMISFTTMGALLSFFYYNVFGNAKRGRKIFMGDTGTLTIGMMWCLLSFKLAFGTPDEGFEVSNLLVLTFSPLLIPCLDVVRVYLHRVRHGVSPFKPDKNHIHHKLLALGLSQRTTLIVLVLTSITVTLLNIVLSDYLNINWILGSDIVIWTLINIWLTKEIKQKEAGRIVPTISSCSNTLITNT